MPGHYNTISEDGSMASGASDRMGQRVKQASKEKGDKNSDAYRNNLKNDYWKR